MKLLTISIMTMLWTQVYSQDVDTVEIKSAFIDLQREPSKSNQTKYLEVFPGSFESFEETFGYENEKLAPLYFESRHYISALFNLDSIPLDQQMSKWIDISIGGHCEADAVNYFQHELRPRVLQKVGLSYQLLKRRSNQEIVSFFYFIFSGVHPKFETIPKELRYLKEKDKEFYALIEKGHKGAIQDSEH